jgi:photosystem II stability/assembly factor-like uncharacterized protein
MRHILIIFSVFLFIFTIISCSEKDEHTTTTDDTTTDDTTTVSSGLFVAVGASGTFLKSTDGTTWTEVNTTLDGSSISVSFNGVTYGGSTFVTVGPSGTILTSSDGTSWDNRTSGTTNNLYGVNYKE